MKKVIILLCLIWGISGCSDEEKDSSTNHQWTITLNETMTNDSYPVSKTEKFLFDQDQLLKHTVRQTVLESEINHEVNLTYSENKVIAATEMTTSTYILNAEGYASQCTYDESDLKREYRFSYSTDGYLTEVIENINNEVYSTLTLTYNNGDLQSITSSLNGISNKILYEPGEESSQYNLPCLDVLDTYPLSLHTEALYAGLLGKAPRHLTASIKPEGNDSEYTTYNYQFNQKGELSQIHSQTTYPNGNSENYYPNRRIVSINYSTQ
ncbi:DUF4595 domain-containing protein [Bacteroides sp.]|uniref:DUF4595 domain-containing protein n=1 Tax=Bacteroides sp. TaxID=29523 RepID=UPI0026333813|nr:DUF4595 domain-containing protein [Bacteroides sp.]MDD3039237.1 DUF4595 domain-containing protein [Bacteroides sp.]